MIVDGPFFRQTLDALQLEGDERLDAERNATNIIRAVVNSYGTTPAGELDEARIPNTQITGLVYGRIQSGKTRAMIASTAMAFDNGFRISVVMTSNINDLVHQTHGDFSIGLPGLMMFTKDNDLEREVPNTRVHLEQGNGHLLLVCSKGSTSLHNIADFLRAIGAEQYPTLVFDDEGDQASLDTNTRRRSTSRIAVAPSRINEVIQTRLRTAVPRNVYVSVTGTPQAVLLQSAESSHRPSFIVMLPPGNTYTGGDTFFRSDEPEDNPNYISLVGAGEQAQLLDRAQPMPEGLRRSLLFFLVSAASAIININLPEKGFSYLCHPSLKNDEQEIAEERINVFLTEVYSALLDNSEGIEAELRSAYDDLRQTLGPDAPPFDDVKQTIVQYLPSRRLLVINARVKRQGIAYGRGMNFLIGGNTLGRGIAIRDLLVTYYVRTSRVSQLDTMHQHARMFGYRERTLAYTRLFVPRQLYYRFRDIHQSDADLREFIEGHQEHPETFPIEYTFNLRTTRTGVLDVNKVDTLNPGKQIYPNYVIVPQAEAAYERMLQILGSHFGADDANEAEIEQLAGDGAEISPNEAEALVRLIKTRSKNTWRDPSIATVIRKVAGSFQNRIILRFRTADRRVDEGGFISTGVLSGAALTEARQADRPTLWIFATESAAGSEGGGGAQVYVPHIRGAEPIRQIVHV
ncbi:Z1 domain-containing protein [Methyloligella solikamskensis]|uniref:Z1 domain-containing protein n=1 Tax=Methyloligella solikamskensis TaxID=1177756 RepID=A0ABW3JAM2_9HYPH